MDEHEKDKKDLEDKIAEGYRNLNDLKKKNITNTIANKATNEKEKDKEESQVNIDDMLTDLTKDIHKAYKRTMKVTTELEAKQTIDLLKVNILIDKTFKGYGNDA